MKYTNPDSPWIPSGYDPFDDVCSEESSADGCLRTSVFTVSFILLLIAVVFMLASCTTTEYVTTVEHKTDSVYITQHLRDSIYVHDSTYVKEKGDTLLIERWHTAWRDRLVHDTTVVVRIDSVPVPYPVIKKVPAELTWWQKTRLKATNILMLFILVFIIIVFGKKHLKKLMP